MRMRLPWRPGAGRGRGTDGSRATAVPAQFINHKYIRINFKSSLNHFLFFIFIFVFCNSYYNHSTELNSTSKTKSCYSRVRGCLHGGGKILVPGRS